MKMFKVLLGLKSFLVLVVSSAVAGIHLGNDQVTLVVDNTNLCLGGATLDGGVIKVVGTGGVYTTDPADEEDTGAPIVCSNTQFIYASGGVVTESFALDGSIGITGETIGLVCGDNQVVTMQEGLLSFDIVAQGGTSTPTVVQGSGNLASLHIDGGKQVNIAWLGTLNVPIYAAGDRPTLKLKNDLRLAPGIGFDAANLNHTTVVTFDNNRLFIGGTRTPSVIAHHQEWDDALVELTGSVNLATAKTILLTGTGAFIQGNGNWFTFNDGSAHFDNNGTKVTFADIVLTGMSSDSLAGAGVWNLRNVVLTQDHQKMLVTGSFAAGSDVFAGDVTFNASTITLQSSYNPSGTITFAEKSFVNGDGHSWNFSSTGTISLQAPLSISDTVLANVVAGSFANSGSSSLFLSNVIWHDSFNNISLRISGSEVGSDGAQLFLDNGSSVGSIVGPVTWHNAQIELLSDIALQSQWFCSGTTIVGNGNRLDLSAGTLRVPNGQELWLSDLILDGVVENGSAHSLWNTAGTIHLSNVTIVLGDGNVDWGSFSLNIQIDGPVRVITGDYELIMPRSPGQTVMKKVVVYYDTLGAEDIQNLRGCSGVGCVLPLYRTMPAIWHVVAGQARLVRSQQLASLDSGDAEHARTLVFNGDTEFNGKGYSITFPQRSETVITVSDTTRVTFTNILLDGLMPDHFEISPTDGAVLYGNGSVIRLENDWILQSSIQFGSASDALGEYMVLDLNRHTIDMAHTDAFIGLQGSTGQTMRICNGRIINLSNDLVNGPKLDAAAGTTIILENVELGLADDYTYQSAALQIEGICSITGTPTTQLMYNSTANLTVTKGASFTIGDGIVYCHNNEGISNFILADKTAVLSLVGSTFKRKDTTTNTLLALTTGTLLIDDKALVNVGTKGISFGDGTSENDLSIIINPDATIGVNGSGSGTLSYLNQD